MTHSESFKSFEDIENYLVLEDERRDASKANVQDFPAKSAWTCNPKQKTNNKKAWKKKGGLISQIRKINLKLREIKIWC